MQWRELDLLHRIFKIDHLLWKYMYCVIMCAWLLLTIPSSELHIPCVQEMSLSSNIAVGLNKQLLHDQRGLYLNTKTKLPGMISHF